MGKNNDHSELGKAHAIAGIGRYKFQDPHLQELYDRGYDGVDSSWQRRAQDDLENFLRRSQQGSRKF